MATTETQARVTAELNDLLQLDHDATQAYSLAIEAIEEPRYRETLIRFRADHERHIRELTELIEEHGGIPMQLSHIPTGPMKLAVQAVGNAGGDREVLLAFKSNERQVRDRYRKAAAEAHDAGIAALLNRNAVDEERHYAWVSWVLEELGAGPDTPIGRAEETFETVHGGMATAIERAERGMMSGFERLRRSPAAAAAAGIAGLLVLRRIMR